MDPFEKGSFESYFDNFLTLIISFVMGTFFIGGPIGWIVMLNFGHLAGMIAFTIVGILAFATFFYIEINNPDKSM